MKLTRSRALLLALAALGALALAAALVPRRDGPASRPPEPAGARAPRDSAPLRPSLSSVGDAERDAQIHAVVESMDRTGRPPAGVAQGGRRGAARGGFENLEGRLPRRPRGYYVESDVWPRGPSGRGAERLVFGREGEVYYTADHYRSFVRLR